MATTSPSPSRIVSKANAKLRLSFHFVDIDSIA